MHVLSTPPAFILSQDRTLNKIIESHVWLKLLNKNSILRIEKGPFYFKFCILFNFQDPRFSFDFSLAFQRGSVKVLVKDIPQRLVCQEVFSSFLKFFSKGLKPFIQLNYRRCPGKLKKRLPYISVLCIYTD